MITEIKKGDRFVCFYNEQQQEVEFKDFDGSYYFYSANEPTLLKLTCEEFERFCAPQFVQEPCGFSNCEQHEIESKKNPIPSIEDYCSERIKPLILRVSPHPSPEPIKPNYYKFTINGTHCNMFDIGKALGLSLELFSALKYFRVKGGIDKRINDLQKAKECIDLEIANLQRGHG